MPALAGARRALLLGGELLVPPAGYVFITDNDGAYLVDSDGAYIVEAA